MRARSVERSSGSGRLCTAPSSPRVPSRQGIQQRATAVSRGDPPPAGKLRRCLPRTDRGGGEAARQGSLHRSRWRGGFAARFPGPTAVVGKLRRKVPRTDRGGGEAAPLPPSHRSRWWGSSAARFPPVCQSATESRGLSPARHGARGAYCAARRPGHRDLSRVLDAHHGGGLGARLGRAVSQRTPAVLSPAANRALGHGPPAGPFSLRRMRPPLSSAQ